MTAIIRRIRVWWRANRQRLQEDQIFLANIEESMKAEKEKEKEKEKEGEEEAKERELLKQGQELTNRCVLRVTQSCPESTRVNQSQP